MKNQELFNKIKIMSNKYRFEILELTYDKPMTITELSKVLKLSYNSCADYVALLEKYDLISKTRDGKNVYVKSEIELNRMIL